MNKSRLFIGLAYLLPAFLSLEIGTRVFAQYKAQKAQLSQPYNPKGFRGMTASNFFFETIRSHPEFTSFNTSVGTFSTVKYGLRGNQNFFTEESCEEKGIQLNPIFCTITLLRNGVVRKKIALYLGGSTTFGIGSTDEGTFPKLLTKILNSQNLKTIGINLGTGGWSSYEQLNMANMIIAQSASPDYIFSLDGVNETRCLYFDETENLDGSKTFASTKSSRSRLKPSSKNKSMFLDAVYWKLKQLFTVKNSGTQLSLLNKNSEVEKRAKTCARLYVNYLETLAGLAFRNRKHRDKSSRSDLPVIVYILQSQRNFNNPEREPREIQERIRFLKLFYEQVSKLAPSKSSGIRLVRVNAYDSTYPKGSWIDDDHLNDDGNEFLAYLVMNAIKDRL